MKLLFSLLLLAGYACAQTPAKPIRVDSPRVDSPRVDSPRVDSPRVDSPDLMPNARTNNSFYRYHMDPKNVMRATLDNMPVKVSDSSINYTMLRSYPKWRRLNEPPRQFLKPMPPIVPKKP